MVTTVDTTTPARETLLDQLAQLIEDTLAVDWVIPQDTGWFSLEDDLLLRIESLLGNARELMKSVTAHFDAVTDEGGDQAAEGDEADFLQEIGAQISSELAAREIADLSFMGRKHLGDAHEALQRARGRGRLWEIVSHADTGLRRMAKALIALESAMREFEGLAPKKHRWDALEDSIEVRRTYGQFRRAIQRAGQPTAKGLRTALRSALRRIAILRDLKIYPYLRIDDRREVRSFQKRISSWLGLDKDDAETESAGRRLWQDLQGFARLLAQVNNRQELREHDRRLVKQTLQSLSHDQASDALPPAVLAELESLLGRDDELDELLSSPKDHGSEDWRVPLERLQSELDKVFAGASPGL